MVKRY